MDVIITEWALQSYLDLKSKHVFTDAEYKQTLRPDAELLKGGYPSQHSKFSLSSFWGPAKDRGGNVIKHGFKMKWDSIGPGRVELRLLIAIMSGNAYLCEAYVKSSPSIDTRKMLGLKDHINLISLNRHKERGKL